MIVPLLIGTIAVVFMFQINTYIYVGKTFNLDNIPTKALLQYILYETPSYLNMTFAVGMALGSSLAMSRLARESELTAVRSTGTSIWRALFPFIFMGMLVAGLNYYVAERVMPRATKRSKEIAYRIGIVGLAENLKENAIVPLEHLTLFVGHVQKINDQEMKLERVMILKQDQPGEMLLIVTPNGRYKQGEWTFSDARVVTWAGDDIRPALARELTIHEPILTDALFSKQDFPEERTADQLREAIALLKSQGMSYKNTEVELNNRYAVPFACIVFGLVGPVFAIYFARSGGFTGVLLSIVMVMLYYNAWVISTQILPKWDFIPGWFAAWLPNILFATLGLIGIRRLE